MSGHRDRSEILRVPLEADLDGNLTRFGGPFQVMITRSARRQT